MLAKWLAPKKRRASRWKFTVTDLTEASERTPQILTYLQTLVKTARFSREFIQYAAQELGWGKIQQLLVNKQPTLSTVKRGDFGEALSVAVLGEFDGYVIPVPKLRYKITNNQTQPSTDAVAFRIRNGTIVEACFVESKLRTSRDSSAAAKGYTQLNEDYKKELPDMLTFIAQRLFESDRPLADSFMAYLRRRDEKEIDTFAVSLIVDGKVWEDSSLDNVEEQDIALTRVSVRIVHAADLAVLVDSLYARLGITCDGDE